MSTSRTPYRGYPTDVQLASQYIRQSRLAQGITQEALARTIGASLATVARAELGRRLIGGGHRPARARLDLAQRIATALGAPLVAVIQAPPRAKPTRSRP